MTPTGSRPKKLKVRAFEKVTIRYEKYNFIFNDYAEKLFGNRVRQIGRDSQALNRLGSKVTVIQHGNRILSHDG